MMGFCLTTTSLRCKSCRFLDSDSGQDQDHEYLHQTNNNQFLGLCSQVAWHPLPALRRHQRLTTCLGHCDCLMEFWPFHLPVWVVRSTAPIASLSTSQAEA